MNTPSRIVTPERRSDDVGDTAMRPQLLSEFVGQAQARKNLSIFIEAARKRSENSMPRKLAAELLEASENRGGAVKKREETHRMADANKAFSHYRW